MKSDGYFKPGNPGGPGRPPAPECIRELRKLNQVELKRVINEFLLLTKEQLTVVMKDPESTVLQLMIASIIMHGIKRGDNVRFNFLLDRLVGTMKTQIEISGKIDVQPLPVMEILKDDTMREQAHSLLEKIHELKRIG